MSCSIDLRYAIPPVTNIFLMLLYDRNDPISSANMPTYDHLVITWVFLLVLVIVGLVMYLLTSLNLDMTVIPHSIHFRTLDFSVPVTLSLLCSLFLWPRYFWVAFALILSVSPWLGSVFEMLKTVIGSFPNTDFIIRYAQEQEPPQEEIEFPETGPEEEQDYIVLQIE